MAKKEGRSSSRNVFFRDQEMNFTVLRALLGVHSDGATIGECLAVVQNTRNGDIEGFVGQWIRISEHCANRAEEALAHHDRVRAREFFFRAANFAKSAMVILNPLDRRHRLYWQTSLDLFLKAGALLELPLEQLPVDFEGEILPCFFLPAAKGRKSPVVVIVTGGEGCAVENYFWAGAYALKNGYSVLLYEGPGNIATMHTNGLLQRPDSEVPIGRVLDHLLARPDVDDARVALLGLSFGGYLVARAAAFDKRIKAVIPDSPLRNIHRMLKSVLPSFTFSLPNFLMEFVKNHLMPYSDRATLDLLLWEGGVATFREGVERLKPFSIEGIEHQITCPTLALTGDGEGTQFVAQAREFLANIGATEKVIREFHNSEGAGSHCQADNSFLMNQEVIAWLNHVFSGPPVDPVASSN